MQITIHPMYFYATIALLIQLFLILVYGHNIALYFSEKKKNKIDEKKRDILRERLKVDKTYDDIAAQRSELAVEIRKMDLNRQQQELISKKESKQEVIESMPCEWKTLYNNVRTVELWHAKEAIIKSFCQEAESNFVHFITGSQALKILRLLCKHTDGYWVNNAEEQRVKNASQWLAPYVRAEESNNSEYKVDSNYGAKR